MKSRSQPSSIAGLPAHAMPPFHAAHAPSVRILRRKTLVHRIHAFWLKLSVSQLTWEILGPPRRSRHAHCVHGEKEPAASWARPCGTTELPAQAFFLLPLATLSWAACSSAYKATNSWDSLWRASMCIIGVQRSCDSRILIELDN